MKPFLFQIQCKKAEMNALTPDLRAYLSKMTDDACLPAGRDDR